MGYYAYCPECREGISKPDLQELRQGYVTCWNCGAHWEDINQIDSLFDLIEDLQEQVKELKEK